MGECGKCCNSLTEKNYSSKQTAGVKNDILFHIHRVKYEGKYVCLMIKMDQHTHTARTYYLKGQRVPTWPISPFRRSDVNLKCCTSYINIVYLWKFGGSMFVTMIVRRISVKLLTVSLWRDSVAMLVVATETTTTQVNL